MATDDAVCAICGTTVTEGECPQCRVREESRVVHREFLVLAALTAVAVALFFVTKLMADDVRHVRLNTAQTWYVTGTARLSAHDVRGAVDAFRTATMNDTGDRVYALALANALAMDGQAEDATAVLIQLREAAPEDADVNLQLARIAASQSDVTTAVRYYRNALYGVWSHDEAESLKSVRFELVRFLLAHQHPTTAASELLILSTTLTAPADQVQVGQLLLQAGEYQRASAIFTRVLQVDPHNADALTGAADAAYRIAAYDQAAKYFRLAAADRPLAGAAAAESAAADFIVVHDPLAAHLSPEERMRRLLGNIDLVAARLTVCAAQPAAVPATAEITADRAQMTSFRSQLQLEAVRRDPQIVDHGVSLVDTIEQTTGRLCGTSDATHTALLLIGRLHSAEIR